MEGMNMRKAITLSIGIVLLSGLLLGQYKVSGTVTDASGRILSGQTVSAFWNSIRHANPLTIGRLDEEIPYNVLCALDGATLARAGDGFSG